MTNYIFSALLGGTRLPIPNPLLALDFTQTSAATAGFSNSATGTYYSIGSNGNYTANRVSNAFDQPTYTDGGAFNLGIGVWTPYTNNIRNNSMQGAASGSGVNFILNGNFALNPLSGSQNVVLNNWQHFTSGSGNLVWNNVDTVTLTGDGTHNVDLITQAYTVTANQICTIKFDIGSGSGTLLVGSAAGTNTYLQTAITAGTNKTVSFTPTGTTIFITFANLSLTPMTVKNVSSYPGALPNFWDIFTGAVNVGTLSVSVSNVGTQNGIDVGDLRIQGTPSGAGVLPICFDTNTVRAATTAQTWQVQTFLQQVAGSQTNISSIGLGLNENTSTGVIVQTDQSAITVLSSGLYTAQRFVNSITTSGGGTVACMQPGIFINYSGASAIDITLRIGWPMTLNTTRTIWHPPIRTTNASVLAQQDQITLPVSITGQSALVIRTTYVLPAATAVSGAASIVIDDGTTNNRYEQSVNTSGSTGGGCGASITQAGTLIAVLDGAISHVTLGVQHCIAARFDLNGVSIAVDGSAVVTQAGSSTALSLTTLRLGRISSGQDPLDGYLQKVYIYEFDPSDQTLSEMSKVF